MFARLVFLFVSIPLIELYLLLQLNELTGNAFLTIGLILFTGVVGAWLAKQQGLSTISRIQKATSEGRLPTTELLDGGMILFAAALLLTPGVLTDAFGFSLLIPPCRAFYRRLAKRYFPKPNVQFIYPDGSTQSRNDDPSVIDGTARTVEESKSLDDKTLE